MLRLPQFELETPTTTDEVVRLLSETPDARVIAGGTDILPNMKHGLLEPPRLVSLQEVNELRGIEVRDAELRIGAMTPLAEVASHALVLEHAPALAQAASLVAGPQLRTMGTLGGNVLLDTRCQWYNQTHFWREALGFCLKKDGTACHVVQGGKNCVAAASNDSVPALMTLGASLTVRSAEETRTVQVDEIWTADGIWNKKIAPSELLTEIRVPLPAKGHRGAYGKLRDRGSIDFPLLGVAVRIDLNTEGAVDSADCVVTALAARPIRLKHFETLLTGVQPGDNDAWNTAVAEVAQRAFKQCHPLANIPGDHEYRREMVPVYVKRTIAAAIQGDGPVHHI